MTNSSSLTAHDDTFTSCAHKEDSTPAHFSSRLMAFLIDSLLLAMIYTAGIFFAGYNILDLLGGELQMFLDLSVLLSLFVLLGPVFISMIYYIVLHAYSGQTIGKSIMGIKVVTVSDKPLGYLLSLVRWLGYQLSALPFFAGFLWAVLDVDKRSWHDILARSKVVNYKTS